MIDHTRITVADFANTKAWYEKVLAPIGYKLLVEVPGAVTGQADVAGFGDPAEGEPGFWLVAATPDSPAQAPVNVGFRVKSRAMVDAFHNAAIAKGGTDNGQPGLRPSYGVNSYGAFVRVLHGHTLGAICHAEGTGESPVSPQRVSASESPSHNDIPMPRNVRLFEQLSYISLVITSVSFTLDKEWRAETGYDFDDFFFSALLTIFLIFMVARKRQNWARITYLVLAIFSLLMTAGDEVADIFRPDPFLTLINIVSAIMFIIAIVLVFIGDANDWFRKPPNT